MISKKFTGKIGIIGERELVLGFRLIGIENSYIVKSGEEGVKKFTELFKSDLYSIIMLSESLKKYIDPTLLKIIELSTRPLVVFVPLPGGTEEESVSALAKRILGVEMG